MDTWIKRMAFLSALAVPALAARAQEVDPAAAAVAPQPGLSAGELFAMGGWMMYALAAISVVGVALVFYYLFALRAGRVAPEAIAIRLRELLKAGRVREAKELCRANRSALACVAGAALAFRAENPSSTVEAVKEVMESEGSRQTAKMQEAVRCLSDIAALAPMVGLLGTVIGMLKDKDIFSSLSELKGIFDRIFVCSLPGERGSTAEHVRENLLRTGMESEKVETFDTAYEAYVRAVSLLPEDAELVVCGSFVTAEELLRKLNA